VKLLSVLLLSLPTLGRAYDRSPDTLQGDIKFLLSLRPAGTCRPSSPRTSEAKLVLTGLIRLYRRFISSQDVPSCNFTLSCSHFAEEAISKYGPIHGVLMAADRLMRCYGLGRRYYPTDPETGLAVDRALKDYHLGRRR